MNQLSPISPPRCGFARGVRLLAPPLLSAAGLVGGFAGSAAGVAAEAAAPVPGAVESAARATSALALADSAGIEDGPFGADFREVVRAARARVFPAVVYIKCIRQGMESGRARGEEVSGSGVVISPEGEVLSNWHVVDRASEIRCLLSDGRSFHADLVASDQDLDLALLRLRAAPSRSGEPEGEAAMVSSEEARPIPFAAIGPSGLLEEGDFVMAMGAPWGLNRSVSVGIIACTRRYLPDSSEYSLWLQTDASISPGNSGGPLVDTHGRVIGINTLAQMVGGDLGFAVPSDTIAEVLPRMRLNGEIGWSWLGLRLQPLRDFDRDIWFGGTEGVIVAGVEPGSPAEAAGIASRDRLLSVDGVSTDGLTAEDLPDIRRRLALLPAERPVEARIQRGAELLTVVVTPTVKGKVQGEEVDFPRWGLTAKTINRFENPELHRRREQGVFVFGTRWPGNAASSGIAPMDIILEIDGLPITTLGELQAAYDRSVAALPESRRLVVRLLRAGQQRQIVMDISRDHQRK
ncbi:MAG TPA: trypsin-like peptidase domain-containing protein [Phycisphaerales bacterium]|nr:trypsin-like peptidase domain-containing protein [Phycisphaerales bacterium]HMP37069.1 trypsin-like peptidase domain-containing protein [Phycisphaerales bacterium]